MNLHIVLLCTEDVPCCSEVNHTGDVIVPRSFQVSLLMITLEVCILLIVLIDIYCMTAPGVDIIYIYINVAE